ncbi:MAG: geranylgeranylglyceryl/heptaprenylglyceryl phosphate synthase [Bacteroidia bacterium]|nr:geranylgeranylglyceryl/heptaprenylglyceryl phosphate synthase [Bacteroidia bacterium]NNF30439.1 geranylgeranylglyceryl/heptaprenylglyceryl phosphate synthase [Flavobacteriaceae bacterium]MBT8275660.1 geranylgeranylglyceryl/heptaprenylglyceryl phosphate synthase [Bacteroidia bacterium]NNJ82666.1 geranylgeranylglyceryl/heptaprenylglyceryl phosphate synthase [Flavobacteriaceae bacterium]NNK54303.1 geranylgeranylglyceryl/heptaprenylglyceryl phosphate synthase [Flavobacteriaceae bacterium]
MMGSRNIYNTILEAVTAKKKLLAILIDPEKFDLEKASEFLRNLPSETTHLFIGGSTVPRGLTHQVVETIKLYTAKTIVLFPGDVSQITESADALLYLSLFSGDNPEYLVGQQIKAVPLLRSIQIEIIPTGYILVDGGNGSAVATVTRTRPIPQHEIQRIVDTAVAAELSGKKLIYLEAGSGARIAIIPEIISEVKKELQIPLIVGGGIRTADQVRAAYDAGADMVVIGTAFENGNSLKLKN